MNKILVAVGAVILMFGLSVAGQAQTLSVTNGLTLQLKADGTLFQDDVGTTPVTDGSNVGLWQNAGSAAGGDASQATLGLQPTFHLGVLNGKPVVRFSGSYLSTSGSALNFLGATEYTTFAVFLARSITTSGVGGYDNNAVWMNRTGDEGLSLTTAFDTSFKVIGYNYPGAPSQVINSNQFTFAVDSLGGGNVSIRSAGAGSGTTGTVTSATGGTTAGSFLNIGANYDFSKKLDGDIAELLFYNRALTGLEMDSVTTYLNDKYALGLIAAVPEPSTIALVGAAGLAFLGLRRRRT